LGKKTVLGPATKKGESLRTTVPVSIVRQFNLKVGDKLDWSLIAKDDDMIIVVRPVEVA